MLANPLPYNIRIDTFEIWRSRADLSGGCGPLRDSGMRSAGDSLFERVWASFGASKNRVTVSSEIGPSNGQATVPHLGVSI